MERGGRDGDAQDQHPRPWRMKAEGAKIVMITAYDALFARIFDDAGVT